MKQYKGIASRNNSIYKLIEALSQKKVPESNGLFLMEAPGSLTKQLELEEE